jgi:sporulation integral membrane protein YtvI
MKESKVILYIKIILNLLLFALIMFLILFIVPKLLHFFLPFVIGWIVAMIANPLVHFLEKKVKILRKHSSAIIIIVVISAIIGAFYWLISILVKESIELANDLPNIVANVSGQFNGVSQNIRNISTSLPDNLQSMIDGVMASIGSYVTNFVDNMTPPTMSTFSQFTQNIAEGFLYVIIGILSAYFFIAERDVLVNGIKKSLPDSMTNGWCFIYDNFKSAVGGYFKAQFKIMLILSVVMFIGFEVLKINYSILVALGIAFLDLLPVFGTGAILWPWALIDMIMGNYFRAVGLIVIYLACQIIKQVLQPKMVGDSIGISPLATLFFMFVGYRFYGVLGMILGIPFGMIMVNLYRVGMFDRLIRGFKIIIHDINDFRKF